MTTPPGSLRRWTRGRGAALLLVLAVLVGGGLRAVMQTPTARYSSDTYHYLLLAEHLVAGEGFVSGGSEHADLSRPVLYPLGIAAFLWPLGDSELAARLLTALSGALAVVPLFFLARAAFGPGAALAMLPLAALSCLLGGSVRLLPTSVSTLLALAALAATFAATQRGRLPFAVLAGLLAGATALARSEGVVWPLLLGAWVLLAPGLVPRPAARRALAAAALLAASLLVYTPYVAWASARLGRFDMAPPITYLTEMRSLSDRLGLRWIDAGSLPWQQRALGLLTADHRARLLEERFSHSRDARPDAAAVDSSIADLQPGQAAATGNLLRRRAAIAARNAMDLQTTIRYGHFAPAVIVVLALAGLPTLLAWRRRRSTLYLLVALAGSLAPVFSHVEQRFLYVAFGLTLLPAAAGAATLIRLAGRSAPGRATLARTAVATGLLFLVVGAGLAHARALRRPQPIETIQDETAAALAAGPAGAVLAVQPAVAYRAGRPFRLVPVASPAAVLTYARAQGATQLVLEGDRDLGVRPDLAVLAGDHAPPGFIRLRDLPDPRGGRVHIYALGPPAATTDAP